MIYNYLMTYWPLVLFLQVSPKRLFAHAGLRRAQKRESPTWDFSVWTSMKTLETEEM